MSHLSEHLMREERAAARLLTLHEAAAAGWLHPAAPSVEHLCKGVGICGVGTEAHVALAVCQVTPCLVSMPAKLCCDFALTDQLCRHDVTACYMTCLE